MDAHNLSADSEEQNSVTAASEIGRDRDTSPTASLELKNTPLADTAGIGDVHKYNDYKQETTTNSKELIDSGASLFIPKNENEVNNAVAEIEKTRIPAVETCVPREDKHSARQREPHAFAGAKPVAKPPGEPSRRPPNRNTNDMHNPDHPWSLAVLAVGHESQYGLRAYSACTAMALAACQLLLRRPAPRVDSAAVSEVLHVGASLYGSSDLHSCVSDVLSSPTGARFANLVADAHALEQTQMHVSALHEPGASGLWACLGLRACSLGEPLAVVLTKPPESLSVAAWPKEGDACTFWLFDSHARAERGVPGAAFLKFDTQQALAAYLRALWPVMDLGDASEYHKLLYHLCDASVFRAEIETKVSSPPFADPEQADSADAGPARPAATAGGASAWTCSECTFENSAGGRRLCEMCGTVRRTGASSAPPHPACKHCTYANAELSRNWLNCFICGQPRLPE
jgi:hypothetical protein